MREDTTPAKPMTGTVVPLPSLVPAPPEILERAYALWSTVGGRNATATRRLLEAEAEDGDAVPTDRAIRKWATEHGWHERADLHLRETAGRTVFELGVKWRALLLGAADVLLAAQTGGFAGREIEGALAVKASEIALRQIERGVLPLVVEPPAQAIDTSSMTRAELEAHNKRQLIQRRRRA
jgi:hypothetical protein